MKIRKVILAAMVLSSLVFTSCEKDSLTKTIDIDSNAAETTYATINESSSYGVLSSIDLQLEAALTVKKYGCPSSELEETTKNTDYRPIDCPDSYVASGYAHGLSQEFGHIKAELTIKYESSSDAVTGLIVLQFESTDEILTVEFRGPLSGSNNAGDMFRFHALSSHNFLDRYFSGFFAIHHLDQLLKSQGQKNIPITLKGVLE